MITVVTRLSPPRGLICQKQFCGWELIGGGLIGGKGLLNLEVFKSTKDNILSFFSIKYFDLNLNHGIIKEE